MSRRWLVLLLAGLVLTAACSDGPDSTPVLAGLTADADPREYPKWQTQEPGDQAAYNRRTNLIQRGRDVYDVYCAACHGDYGDGRGPAAARLITQPRDFTSGVYKFRSTDSGSLPLEQDLYRTLTRGLYGVSMPAFPLMPHRDKLSVIEYIKTFYPQWDARKDDRVIVPVPKAPTDLAQLQRIVRGRVVYLGMQCGQCHGIDGQGTGATRTEYVDAWGNPQKPFNFTRGSLKGGNSAEDIYRTFHTGLRSIMPAYGGLTLASVTRDAYTSRQDQVDEAERREIEAILDQFPAQLDGSESLAEQQRLAERNSWDLVAYILSLRQETTTADAVLGTGR